MMNELHYIQLMALLEHSGDFMGLVGMDGYVKYINKAGRELLGLHPTDDLGHIQSTDFYSKEGYEHLLQEIVPVIVAEGKWSGRMSFTHFHTKEEIPCYTNYILVYDPETKEPVARGVTLRDLRPELAAQEARQRLITLVDNSVELMSILEMDGKNSYINKAGMDLLGFETVQQVADTPIAELHTPEDFAFVQENLLPAVMKEGRWDGTMNVRHLRTGEVFPVQNNCIRIDDAITGEPLCVGAVMRDLRPELKARQAYIEEQKKLQQQKDDFLAIASHELKTPVTSIKAYCQILQRMLQKNNLQEEAAMMGKMDKQINRLTHLIGDLLDVTKINAGKLQFND
ncbi:MAG TPA: histidine kinase dimerization/phospho-acceptor domain-containing protein, partial [Chitinophagaceae bacterium]|nr:histidine kinase dimerization/phospho-acceptor domain-containing protein [Chitinophagaceae bacterium]